MARINYIGNKFGFLTVVSDAAPAIQPSGYAARKVTCVCECGSRGDYRVADLKRGKTTSCGCFKNTEQHRLNRSNAAKKVRAEGGYTQGDTSPKKWQDGYSPFRYLMKSVNNRRGTQEIDITVEDLKILWEQQDGRCAYTGIELVPLTFMDSHRGKVKEIPDYRKPSVDRIDSNIGYVMGNIQIVSKTANFAKNNMTDEEMREFIRIVKES